MGIDLGLERPQLGLGNQALQLHPAALLDVLDDGRGQARQNLVVLAEIAPSTLPRPQRQEPGIAAREPQRNHGPNPGGQVPGSRIEYGHGSSHGTGFSRRLADERELFSA